MKMRKKLAALLAAAMIASVMPMSAFAASRNRVDGIASVAKDSATKKGEEPILGIKLDDKLTTTQSFYLELEGANWLPVSDPVVVDGLVGRFDTGTAKQKWVANPVAGDPDIVSDNIFNFTVENKNTTGNNPYSYYIFEAYRDGAKTLAVRLLGGTNTAVVNGNEAYLPLITNQQSEILPENNPNNNFEFVFPMAAVVKEAEAVVKVQRVDTRISDTSHVFAVSEGNRAKVVVGDVPSFYRTTDIAEIKLEELYAKSLRDVDEEARWFTLELRDTDFTFNVKNDAKLVGQRAYRGKEQPLRKDTSYRLSADKTRLGIRIDTTFDTGFQEKGVIALKGVEVIAARDARDGEVKAVIESKELFKKEIITIAKRGDYKTKLSVADDWKYEVVAGTEKEVTFKLSEELANSLVGSRPATFTFDQGVTIKTDKGSSTNIWTDWNADNILWDQEQSDNKDIRDARDKVKEIENALKVGASNPKGYDRVDLIDAKISLANLLNLYTDDLYKRPGKASLTGENGLEIEGSDDVDAIKDKGKWSKIASKPLANRVHIADNKKSFTVDNFNLVQDKVGSYTFTTTLNIPANVTGDIKVAVAGRGVTEEEIVILKAEAPVTVESNTIDVKVGLKEITTEGKIVIKETKEERLRQGKDIVLRIDDIDSGLKIKSYKATVVEGDLLLDDAYGDWKDGDKAIGVKRSSTEASTIEITDIVMFTDRTVPEGKYDLLIGGTAVSVHAKDTKADKDAPLDAVSTIKSFVNITTKNTEDIAGAGNKAEVKFVVGQGQFLMNGKEVTMDAPAYVKDGRTMVPVRYVATALGVNEDQVTWDGPNQTATIIADKVIQVKLGSKAMLVNGANVPMEVAAELVNDRTFVPIGSIARALGVVVDWDQTNQTVTFNPAK